jgi:hypothetical protein
MAGCTLLVEMIPLHEAMLTGRPAIAQAWSDRVAASNRTGPNVVGAIGLYLGLGRLKDADRMIERTNWVPSSQRMLSAYLRDDPAALRESAAALKGPGFLEPAPMLFIQPDWSHELARERFQENCGPTLPPSVESRLAALHGDVDMARRMLTEYRTQLSRSATERQWFVANMSLARAHELRGDTATALTTLTTAEVDPARLLSQNGYSGLAFWQRLRYVLATLAL